ncbi:NADP-dependent oxidoreductase [Achromobacter piechaudii]|uniref:Zinc-type alcohol dehydrogenase-like protein n=1 Tax=Achromobacter piechaudii TaxID=72556 RepID=A0ABN7ETL3_9BURK|nr:NADP-dependent oxidoreductase [Achromobacter piechaudii]CAB3658524.1 Zinc-type alcohol dehydrogenase-like protein [Achromobacter piechaudii]CAB3822483.1 Zinc-type alcohol dehydrogenase-like protein [Achromobacter piechaudii]CAB3945387.1 Zinc-type alcohol dehydrogenase-like protein [Achromobacter piechaudii]
MKAFIIDRYGKKDPGRIGDIPEPALRDDDVLIQVHAASVNPLDAKIKRGEFKLILPYRFPLVLGNDVAGKVVRVGARVRQFQPGDEVYARADVDRMGAFAEFIAVKASSLALKPANVSMVEAASLPLVALTAWQALVETAKLKSGQNVLIHAGSGGVGSIAIQLAKHLGAGVATTTSTANISFVKALGADVVIDYKQQDFSTVLRDYDVVLNSLDSDVLHKSIQVLKPGGHLISISGPPTPTFAAARALPWPIRQAVRLLSHGIRRKAKQKNVEYTFVFNRADGAQLQQITTLVESGAILPVVDKVFSFDDTVQALAYSDSGRAKGKVVLRVR